MRRRLGRLLPIVMFAMLVQIFAPIAACRALGNTGDPVAGAICSHTANGSLSQDSQTDHQEAGGACCKLCCVNSSATPTTDPQASIVYVERTTNAVRWRDLTFILAPSAVGSNAQARGPPGIS
ncbi:hypothetical protein NB311A_06518 [Nitrobacter sp. Nb-311A]|uniref:DUF2946 domain-containing protein n=1 Tax=unclassified Nitrobacter TaxID=2620411 RepID=UPI000068717E|nr:MULTISPECIES: DUF2946 domain-containing protein [unclassified Nitrobacter]EAQ34031.1 hypothetical protein NB311A_06518 [Nitrobacter sp. Nb-311A]MCB1392332.1 DUF2946 domain-containing protein [Nitrobacter sp.]MCV0386186.1 DUF2946 domain-containing protein [Nitrobacter sp.]